MLGRSRGGEQVGDGEDLTGLRFSLLLDVVEKERRPCSGLDADGVTDLWPGMIGTAVGESRALSVVTISSSLSCD